MSPDALSDTDFVEQYRGLVVRLAVDIKRHYRVSIELDELMAAGFQGLVEARDAYDAARGVVFSSFAYYRIRGAILDDCRRLGAMRRQYKSRVRFEAAANEVLAEAADSEPAEAASLSEVGGWIGNAFDRMAIAFELAEADTRQRATNPERAVSNEQLRRRLRAQVAALSDEERDVIESYYFNDDCMSAIAARYGVSKSWVSRVHTRALKKLRPLVRGGAD